MRYYEIEGDGGLEAFYACRCGESVPWPEDRAEPWDSWYDDEDDRRRERRKHQGEEE